MFLQPVFMMYVFTFLDALMALIDRAEMQGTNFVNKQINSNNLYTRTKFEFNRTFETN